MANFIAITGYLTVTAVALAAAYGARNSGRSRRERRAWTAIAVGFALIAFVRLADTEEEVRMLLRNTVRTAGRYEQRAAFQEPLVAIVAVVAIVFGLWFVSAWYGTRGSPLRRRILIGKSALMAFVPLYALRIISLHAVDQLLYRGGIRLNWILDALFVTTAAGAALSYLLLSRRVTSRSRSQSRPGSRARRR